MMKAKLLEIFQSIQGEGKYAGVRQVFVRFFECNMHCVWCDTPHSIGDTTRRFEEVEVEQLCSQIKANYKGCESVSLTGGEPLLQKDIIKKLIPFFKKEKIPVYLETNGTLPEALKDIIDDLDIIAMDIKLPSSTKCREFWKEHDEFLKISIKKDVFVKTVISSDTDKKDIHSALALIKNVDPGIMLVIQPNTLELNNGVMAKCLEYQEICSKVLPNVRVLPQVHKYMKLR